MPELTPINRRIRYLLQDRGVPQAMFEAETGMSKRILYRDNKIRRSTLMALAYYFGMTVEELVKGTTAEEQWNNT